MGPELEEKLNSIRPLNEARGFCIPCSIETAKLLVNGKNYEIEDTTSDKYQSVGDDEILALHEEIAKKQGTGPSAQSYDFDDDAKSEDFLNYFKSSSPGSVYIVSNDDHTFNMYKSDDNKLYLLDGDVRIFREINSVKDLIADARIVKRDNDEELKEIDSRYSEKYPYNYFCKDDEGEYPTIYYIGKAHADWSEQLKQSQQQTQEAQQKRGFTAGAINKTANRSSFFNRGNVATGEDKKSDTSTLTIGGKNKGS